MLGARDDGGGMGSRCQPIATRWRWRLFWFGLGATLAKHPLYQYIPSFYSYLARAASKNSSKCLYILSETGKKKFYSGTGAVAFSLRRTHFSERRHTFGFNAQLERRSQARICED